jgi:hypothetical protein
LEENANPIAFARDLLRSSTQSLVELAMLCERGDSRLEEIEAFAGISHLARIGGRVGFTVFNIANAEAQRAATEVSKGVALKVVGNNAAWKELSTNYKPAKIAFISRSRLISTFGSRAISQATR